MTPPSEQVELRTEDNRADRSSWPVVDSARTWPTAVGIWAAATILGYLRLPAAARDTLYAEDGRTFLGEWLTEHSIHVLARSYAGYQHLLPRLAGGLVVGVLPVSWWANAMTLIACLLVGGAAALVYVFSRDVVPSPIARLGLAAITVLSPLAGVEAVGNMANLHWYLLYLTFWLLLATPRSRTGAALMTLLAVVVTLTEPQCALLFPLAVFAFVRRPAIRPVVLGWSVGVALQVLTFVSHPRGPSAGLPPVASAIKGYLVNAAMSNGDANGAVLGHLVVRLGWWTATLSLLVLLAFGGFAVWRGTTSIRIAVAGALLASVATWLVSFYINNNPAFYYATLSDAMLSNMPFVRWGTAAAMLLMACIPLAAGALIIRSPHRWPIAAGAVALMVAVMCVSLVSPANDRAGLPWDRALDAAGAQCRTHPDKASVNVPTYPAGWPVPVACSNLR